MPDTIVTLHPQGKAGVNIDRRKYDTVRGAILSALERSPGLPFWDLVEAVRDQIGETFDGSIEWYTTTVKLDLEARGEIERVPKATPQRLRLTAI
ncbi:MAG: hypothetical protein IPM16_18685 [Chloroflexi bacterium]|nr:hypothetical protein [Chloroflexota bacterium]